MRRILITAGAALAAVIGLALPAAATTNTCTNISIPPAQPVGCGGLLLDSPGGFTLALEAQGNAFNAHVVIEPQSVSDSMQDWTVFQVAGTTPSSGGIDNMGEYVAALTPFGKTPAHTAITAADYPTLRCLSVELTAFKHRWHTVLRPCGGTLSTVPASGTGSGDTAIGAGVQGIVTSPNHFQVWSPATGTGLLLANQALSGNLFNHPFMLDDTANGGAGTWQIAYPENDNANEQWDVTGCTNPIASFASQFWNCP